MAINAPAAPSPNGPPAVIRQPTLPGGEENFGQTVVRVLPAWIVSAVVHAVLLSLFLFVTYTAGATPVNIESSTIESKVDDTPENANLTNEDIGLNPDLPTNYNVDRIEEVSVPGPVDAAQAVGLEGATGATPMTIPPPPGIGEGTGAGLDSKDFGKGSLIGKAGGYGGLLNMPGGMGGRSGATREKMLEQGGGNKESEAAVARGLKWIALHQANAGNWSLNAFHTTARDKTTAGARQFVCNCDGKGTTNDIAATAFGLLPFLAAGETHKPPTTPGSTHYTKNVEQGLKWLMSKQSKDTGDFGGGMYSHGLATIAICEAYGLTSDPILKSSAQHAIDYIVKAQHSAGGWRYAPNQPGDTSVVGWQVMALKSGQMAGLNVPQATLKGAENYLGGVQTSDGGGYGYTDANETPTMTAVGLLCRQYLGWSPRNPGLLNGVARLNKVPPGTLDSMYYYYYATQVMHHMGGESWDKWNVKMRDSLIAKQDKGTNPQRPHQLGSWDPSKDAHGGVGGRLMITSLSTLTLEVYYRHLPLYRRDMGPVKE